MGTRASNVVTHIYATVSFELKMRIEKVGGNRKGSAVSSHRQLYFNLEEKMRFSGGKMVSTYWKLDLTPRMLQKSRIKMLEEVSRHPRSSAEGQYDLGTFVVPFSDGDSEAGCGEAIFKLRFEESVKV